MLGILIQHFYFNVCEETLSKFLDEAATFFPPNAIISMSRIFLKSILQKRSEPRPLPPQSMKYSFNQPQ